MRLLSCNLFGFIWFRFFLCFLFSFFLFCLSFFFCSLLFFVHPLISHPPSGRRLVTNHYKKDFCFELLPFLLVAQCPLRLCCSYCCTFPNVAGSYFSSPSSAACFFCFGIRRHLTLLYKRTKLLVTNNKFK